MFNDKIDVKGRPLFSASDKSDFKRECSKWMHFRSSKTSMYRECGKDSDGIFIYHCIRGTSIIESYHQKLIAYFARFNAGPIFAEVHE